MDIKLRKEKWLDISKEILDCKEVVDNYNQSLNKNDKTEKKFKLKHFDKKKHGDISYFTKKSFNEFKEDNEVCIVGNIKFNQLKYVDPIIEEDEYKCSRIFKKKDKMNISGTISLEIQNDVSKKKYPDGYKHWDLYEPNSHKHTVGYAWLGGSYYVRIVEANPLILLLWFIPILLAFVLIFMSSNNQFAWQKGNNHTKDYAHYEDGVLIADNHDLIVTSKITVDKENQTYPIINPSTNAQTDIYDGVYLRYYVVDEKGKVLYDTKSFPPGKQINVNFYNLMNGKKGTYDMKFYIAVYDYETHEELSPKTMNFSLEVN